MSAPTVEASPPRRLDADARRAQLVQAGLDLLKVRPFDAVGAVEVAAAVGVTKGLVFHYFPTQRDLQVAVAKAAADELVAALETDPSMSNDQRLAMGLDAFVGYIEQNPEAYVAVARGAGANDQLLQVYEDGRDRIAQLIFDGLGLTDPPPALRIGIRGWIAGVEEAVIQWLDGRPIPREELVELLRRAGLALLDATVPQGS
ncbi:MAG TPA: TetR/AcrR family transcriptional regulator [Actinomycetota bacterium]|nr:TetR/AcrR family transcriptional regulator [Actinomycetota bacterium]